MIIIKSLEDLNGMECRKSPDKKHWLVTDVTGSIFPSQGEYADNIEEHLICAHCRVEFVIKPDKSDYQKYIDGSDPLDPRD
jgi:hypothetical protein